MPHVVRTAGINYLPPKALPSDLFQTLKSTNTAVVVSFGASAGAMPRNYVEIFLKAFSRFSDYSFVWKLPTKHEYSIPHNVIVSSWLPQNDLLGYNKTRLFISHCGSNGIHEALYHAVPILGFPLFGDQFTNAFNIEQRGYGVRLNIKTVSADELVQTIKSILDDETIRNKVNKVSRIMRERKPPTQVAAEWTEHVIKYGDEHLRSASIGMPFYELYMLDVLVVLLFLVFVIIGTLIILVKCMCKPFFNSAMVKRQKLD